MAVCFLAREVADLCLGKPALRSVSASATVADALTALKRSGEIYISVWSCNHSPPKSSLLISQNQDDDDDDHGHCRCIGKISFADVICFICKDENALNPYKALLSPVSEILPPSPGLVRHLEPTSSLLEALDYILDGAQNLIIPIENYMGSNSRKKLLNKPSSFGSKHHNGREYCWLTQEDVVRFLLNSIGLFSSICTLTIEALNIIDTDIMTISYHRPASLALAYFTRALIEQTSIAVIDVDNTLIGEISPLTLASCCDEAVAAAIKTLSAGELMAYIDCGGPPEDLVRLVKLRLEEKKLGALLELMDEYSLSSSFSSPSPSASSSSSDDEFGSSRHWGSVKHYSARGSEAIVCYPWSSLVAVMIQAIAHRVSYVWVVEEDYSLVGIVTFTGMLRAVLSIADGVQRKPIGENSFKQ